MNQKCTHLDVNKSKSAVLGSRYQRVYPNIHISYVDSYVRDKEQLMNLLNKGISWNRCYMPILVGCVDNNATRKIFDEVFNEMEEIIYIDSGNGTNDRVGQTVVGYKKKVELPKIVGAVDKDGNEIIYPKYAPKIILPPASSVFPDILEDAETIDKALSCSAVVDEHPQNIATNVLASTNLFMTLTNILTFNKIQAHVSYFDADKQSLISREAFSEIV